MRQRLFFVLIFLIIWAPCVLKGQSYRLELGVTGGTSSYMGEANTNNPMYQPGMLFGITGRYNISGNMALKATMASARISGNTIGRAATFPSGEEIRFNRNLLDADVQFELGFSQYGVASYKPGSSFFCPYLTAGLGIIGYMTDKQRVSVNIPFGFGLKVKAMPRLNIGCEWLFYKTGTDNLDYAVSSSGFQLNNAWAGSSNWLKNKDWYSALKLIITLDLWGTGPECYR
jgi:hypothetical protein